MTARLNNTLFKKIIIIFWALWWLIACWTDLVGIFAHFNGLKASWAPDLNYPFLAKSLAMYHVPGWVVTVLFIGIILWSLVSMLAFYWASFSLRRSPAIWMARARVAFIISLSFWMAFFLADQLVMNFDLEQNHMVQGGFQFLSFLALYILPSEDLEIEI